MNSERCGFNTKPESVVDHSTPKKVISCKDYRKQYGECPVYLPEYVKECDVTLLGKKGKTQTVTYSQYLNMAGAVESIVWEFLDEDKKIAPKFKTSAEVKTKYFNVLMAQNFEAWRDGEKTEKYSMRSMTGMVFYTTFRTLQKGQYSIEYTYVVGGEDALKHDRTFQDLEKAKKWMKSAVIKLMKRFQRQSSSPGLFTREHYRQIRSFIDKCFKAMEKAEKTMSHSQLLALKDGETNDA